MEHLLCKPQVCDMRCDQALWTSIVEVLCPAFRETLCSEFVWTEGHLVVWGLCLQIPLIGQAYILFRAQVRVAAQRLAVPHPFPLPASCVRTYDT